VNASFNCGVVHEASRSGAVDLLAGAVLASASVVAGAVDLLAGAVVPSASVVTTPAVVLGERGPVVVERSAVDPTPSADSESADDRRTPSTTPAKTTAPTVARTSQVASLLISCRRAPVPPVITRDLGGPHSFHHWNTPDRRRQGCVARRPQRHREGSGKQIGRARWIRKVRREAGAQAATTS
jgi:hypothetical protein